MLVLALLRALCHVPGLAGQWCSDDKGGGQRPDLNLCAESRSSSAKIHRTLQALQQLKGPLLSPSVNHEAICQVAKDDRMRWWVVVAVPFSNSLDWHLGGT